MATTLKAFNGIAVVADAYGAQYTLPIAEKVLLAISAYRPAMDIKKGLNIHQPFSEVTSADDRD
jgi:hypothetical protein